MLQTRSERSNEWMRKIPLANFFRKLVRKKSDKEVLLRYEFVKLKTAKSPKRLETKLKAFDSFY